EPVAGEIGQPEILDDLVPVRGVPDGGGGERAAFRADEQTLFRLLAFGEPFEDRPQRVEDRDASLLAALGLFGDEAALAGVGLAGDDDDVLVEADVAGLKA